VKVIEQKPKQNRQKYTGWTYGYG